MLKMVQPNFNLRQKKTPHHDDRAFFRLKIPIHNVYSLVTVYNEQ